MPEIGDFALGKDIGKHRREKYIWLACIDCGKERWVQYDMLKHLSGRCMSCSSKRQPHPIGSKSPRWRGGRYTAKKGYVHIKVYLGDFFYPMADHRGYTLEHRLVMAKHLGRNLHRWELVHHKGIRYVGIKNKSDNLMDNLELTTRGSHTIEHNKGYKDGYAKGLADGRNKQLEDLKKEVLLVQFQNKQLKETLEEILKEVKVESLSECSH